MDNNKVTIRESNIKDKKVLCMKIINIYTNKISETENTALERWEVCIGKGRSKDKGNGLCVRSKCTTKQHMWLSGV